MDKPQPTMSSELCGEIDQGVVEYEDSWKETCLRGDQKGEKGRGK